MARVYNQLIGIELAGPAMVKQYSGIGPLMVKLPGDRGELRAQSGDYVCYDGPNAVGVVGGTYIDAMRADKDELVEEETPTGAHITAVVAKADGTLLLNEPTTLKQGGVPLATAVSDGQGEVHFNVLPGTYTVGPTNPAHGPEVEVVAELETGEEVPPEGGEGEGGIEGGLSRGGRPSKPVKPARPDHTLPTPPPPPRPGNALPGDRFDVTGKPDPHGDYDSKGRLLNPPHR